MLSLGDARDGEQEELWSVSWFLCIFLLILLRKIIFSSLVLKFVVKKSNLGKSQKIYYRTKIDGYPSIKITKENYYI